MEEKIYNYVICLEDDDEVATAVSLDIAQTIVTSLFEKWSEEPRLDITIKRKIV